MTGYTFVPAIVSKGATSTDGEHFHVCRFVLARIAAWRVTPWPVRVAIRLRVYTCQCGKAHIVEEVAP